MLEGRQHPGEHDSNEEGRNERIRQAETAGGDGGEGTKDGRREGIWVGRIWDWGRGEGIQRRWADREQPVIQVKRKENPHFLVVSKEKANKRVAGGGDAGKPGEGERTRSAKAEGEDDSSEGEEGLGGVVGRLRQRR